MANSAKAPGRCLRWRSKNIFNRLRKSRVFTIIRMFSQSLANWFCNSNKLGNSASKWTTRDWQFSTRKFLLETDSKWFANHWFPISKLSKRGNGRNAELSSISFTDSEHWFEIKISKFISQRNLKLTTFPFMIIQRIGDSRVGLSFSFIKNKHFKV